MALTKGRCREDWSRRGVMVYTDYVQSPPGRTIARMPPIVQGGVPQTRVISNDPRGKGAPMAGADAVGIVALLGSLVTWVVTSVLSDKSISPHWKAAVVTIVVVGLLVLAGLLILR